MTNNGGEFSDHAWAAILWGTFKPATNSLHMLRWEWASCVEKKAGTQSGRQPWTQSSNTKPSIVKIISHGEVCEC